VRTDRGARSENPGWLLGNAGKILNSGGFLAGTAARPCARTRSTRLARDAIIPRFVERPERFERPGRQPLAHLREPPRRRPAGRGVHRLRIGHRCTSLMNLVGIVRRRGRIPRWESAALTSSAAARANPAQKETPGTSSRGSVRARQVGLEPTTSRLIPRCRDSTIKQVRADPRRGLHPLDLPFAGHRG